MSHAHGTVSQGAADEKRSAPSHPRTLAPSHRGMLLPTMHRPLPTCIGALVALALASPSSAQLLVAKDGPIVYGHHHLAVSNIEAHKKFWIDTLGGTSIKMSPTTEAVRFPNVFLLMRAQPPTGGSKGTTVNHIGFSVPNLRQTVDRIRANGFRMVTREEMAATQEVKDDIAVVNANTSIAFVMAPDEVKVELVEVRTQTLPIMLHHVHFFGAQNTEMQAWYAKVFGARPRAGSGAFVSADLPGVALNFTQSADTVVGTKGRAIDHIGFEVDNLEAFCKALEAQGIKIDVSYRKVPQTDMFIAFITDPWGTSIELSEGLDKLP
jgi:catechol 2,3-dioxygenase-like lactoylglutathione lyase family enzyme